MVDSVFITGAAEGAFAEALNGLPPWATENTAESIESILQKTLNLQTKTLSQLVKNSTGSGSNVSAKDANDQLDELVKNLKAENSDFGKKKKRWKEEEDEGKKAKSRWKDLDFKQIATTASLTALAAVSQGIEKVLLQNTDVYHQLNTAGIQVVKGMNDVSNGFQSLQQLTSLTNIRYTELAKTFEKYNTALNAYGFGKFAKTLGAATSSLSAFGFTSKESAELLGAYLETQQGYVDITGKSYQDVQKDLIQFADRISKVSLATGMARTAIMSNLEAISKSTEANLLSGQVGSNAAESTLEFISSIKNQNFGKILLKMMTDQIKPLNETFSSFQKIGLGGFGQKLMTFTNSLKGMDPEQASQALKAFEEENHAQIEHAKQQAGFYGQIDALAGDANKVGEALNGLQQTARQVTKVSAEDLEKTRSTNKARNDLANQWESLLSKFQKAFLPTIPMLEFFTKILGWTNNALDTVIDTFLKLPESVRGFIEMGLMVAGAVAGIGALGKASGFVAKLLFGKAGESAAGAAGSVLKGSLGFLSNIIGTVGKFLFRFLGPIAALYAAFELGMSIGDAIYETLSKFDWFNNFFETVFSSIESTWGFIVKVSDTIATGISDAGKFLWNSISDAGKFLWDTIKNIGSIVVDMFPWLKILGNVISQIADFAVSINSKISEFVGSFIGSLIDFLKNVLDKFIQRVVPDFAKSWFGGSDSKSSAASQNPQQAQNTQVTVIKSPTQSTLDSPSKPATQTVNGNQAEQKETPLSGQPGIEKPSPSNTSVTTALNTNNGISEQILIGINKLVSTNQDILKYSKIGR